MTETIIPQKDPNYVPWGNYSDVETIISAKIFMPVFISGYSGNGKTMSVEQACANLGREYVRVQISPETSEDDLIGGLRLDNGSTLFQHGPVVEAMKRGAILLLDEVDRATHKILCIHGILEGKPLLIKKTGELIIPAPGFNAFATGNTKGRGSLDGRYGAATILDDAFLERFPITLEQEFPSAAIEQTILFTLSASLGITDKEFPANLVKWAGVIRTTFISGGIEDPISTRRLTHIIRAYAVFKNRRKAIEKCIARFSTDTNSALIDLYTKIDKTV